MTIDRYTVPILDKAEGGPVGRMDVAASVADALALHVINFGSVTAYFSVAADASGPVLKSMWFAPVPSKPAAEVQASPPRVAKAAQYAIGEKVPIRSVWHDADFDRACASAVEYAAGIFGADDCGHLTRVADSDRSRDAIRIKFTDYEAIGSMGGWEHVYVFEAWVERAV